MFRLAQIVLAVRRRASVGPGEKGRHFKPWVKESFI